MKKLLLFSLLAISAYGQDKFDSYTNSYLKKDFQISISQNKDNSIAYYVDCMSFDKLSNDAVIVLDSKNLEEFKNLVAALKEVHATWSKTAIDNKVTELEKEVDGKKMKIQSAFKYGGWNFDFSTNLSAYFKIIGGKYVMILRSDQLESSSNRYIKSSGLGIPFESPTDFDDLIAKLDENKAKKFFENKKNKEDLFKN